MCANPLLDSSLYECVDSPDRHLLEVVVRNPEDPDTCPWCRAALRKRGANSDTALRCPECGSPNGEDLEPDYAAGTAERRCEDCGNVWDMVAHGQVEL